MAAVIATGQRPFVQEVLGRSDYAIISGLIEPGTKVLDLGCGDGELLQWLAENKGVEGRGIEISSTRVQRAISRGVSVYQGDIDQGLTNYPDQAFDYVILSQTLQATSEPKTVLSQMVRIGRRAIVSFPNFGWWKVRLHLLFCGAMPTTEALHYEWYDTPNIHLCTIYDFVKLCEKLGVAIEESYALTEGGQARGFRATSPLANLLSEQGIFLLARR